MWVEISRNHETLCKISEEILCQISGVLDPSAITECFRVTEKQMFMNAPTVATSGDKNFSHLHHLSDLGFQH